MWTRYQAAERTLRDPAYVADLEARVAARAAEQRVEEARRLEAEEEDEFAGLFLPVPGSGEARLRELRGSVGLASADDDEVYRAVYGDG